MVKFIKEIFFGVDSVSVGKRKKIENFFSLLLLKIIVSFWKSGKVNNEYFNKKFWYEEIMLFLY